jgi:hypothetical protein
MHLLVIVALLSFSSAEPFRMLFGGCNNQRRDSIFWPFVRSRSPALFVWLGDIIYAEKYRASFSSRFLLSFTFPLPSSSLSLSLELSLFWPFVRTNPWPSLSGSATLFSLALFFSSPLFILPPLSSLFLHEVRSSSTVLLFLSLFLKTKQRNFHRSSTLSLLKITVLSSLTVSFRSAFYFYFYTLLFLVGFFSFVCFFVVIAGLALVLWSCL